MNEPNKIIRQYNDILNLFRLYKGIDKSEISRRLQLSMPTIYNAVDSLTTAGILKKKDSAVVINKDYGTLVGISIGSSLCKVSFIDYNFDVFSSEEFETHKKKMGNKLLPILDDKDLLNKCIHDSKKHYILFRTPKTFSLLKDVLDNIFDYLKDCITNNILNVLSIGISCTGIINKHTQTILNSHNLSYLNNATLDTLMLPDKRIFFETNCIHTYLIQNSSASVIAEKINLYKNNSIYKQKENIVSLYLGVGLGAGLYMGRLYDGTNGYAGEISHTKSLKLESDEEISHYQELLAAGKLDKVCSCGANDCYDYKIRSYVFEEKAIDFSRKSSEDIRNYLNANPTKAKLLSQYLGNIINSITSFLDIDLIIFTGKFYNSMDLLMNQIDIIQDQNTMRFSRNDCKILTSTLGSLSPSVGAAIYAYHKKHDIDLAWNY